MKKTSRYKNPVKVRYKQNQTTVTSTSPIFIKTSVEVQTFYIEKSNDESNFNQLEKFTKYFTLCGKTVIRIQVSFHAVFDEEFYEATFDKQTIFDDDAFLDLEKNKHFHWKTGVKNIQSPNMLKLL